MPVSNAPSTDQSLLRRVLRHDSAAWQTFVRLYGPLIYSWGRRAGLSSEDSADMLQETLLAVAKGLAGFQYLARGSFRAWLWGISTHKIRDQFRRSPPAQAVGGSTMQNHISQLADPLSQESTSDFPEDTTAREKTELLLRGLASLQSEFEPQTWKAFHATVLEGKDTATVAAQLGTSPANVRQARSRILRRLREQLGEFFT